MKDELIKILKFLHLSGLAANWDEYLKLAAEALSAGKKVFVMDGIGDRDYTPDREPSRAAAELHAHGAVSFHTIADLIRQIEA